MTAPTLTGPRCLTSVYASRLRVALLSDANELDPGDENLYVTDSLITIGSTPDIDAGQEFTQRNGGGDICAYATSDDIIKRRNLAMTLCHLDAELLVLLTGATVVTQGGIAVGLQEPKIGDVRPAVCIEAWSEAHTSSQRAVNDGAALWFHWIWPHVKWTMGAFTLENGILTVPLTGKASENDSMGTGPAGDWPGLFTSGQSWYLDEDIPDSVCGVQELIVSGSS